MFSAAHDGAYSLGSGDIFGANRGGILGSRASDYAPAFPVSPARKQANDVHCHHRQRILSLPTARQAGHTANGNLGAALNNLLERLGAFAARRHWVVIVLWLVILGGLTAANHSFGGTFVNDYTVPGSQSQNGLNVLNSDYSSQGGYGGHGQCRQASRCDQGGISGPFSSSQSGAVSQNGEIAYSSISWSDNPAGLTTSYLDKLNNAVAPARNAGLNVEYGGGAGLIGQQTSDQASELIGLAAALILLLLMFASLITAALPLVSAIFSVGSGLAIVGLIAAVVTIPTTGPTVATLLGLGVAIDYGLFLVARHREQLDNGMDVIASVGQSESTSGAAIVIAGSTVVVAILGLYVSGVPFVGAMGLSAAIVVAVTMAAALTLIPSFMGVVKNNVRSLKSRVQAHRADISPQDQARQTAEATDEKHEQSGFARWGRRVSRAPWPWVIAGTLVLLILAIPLLSINLGQPDNGTNPTSDSDRRAYDYISDGFGVGTNGPLTVVVKLPKQSSSDDQSLLNSMIKSVGSTSGVESVTPAAINSAATVAVFNAIPTTRPQATATVNLVSTLRDDVLTKFDVTTYVTGTVPGNVDFTHQISSRILLLILIVVLIAFILLTTAFRSVVIATKAAIMNLLSIGASYGVVVAIFQWGWGISLIGVPTTSPIPAYVPMMMFAIIFGLSMDYEVFLLSRMHESWIKTGDAQRSVAIGIGSTARVITTAAAIMVVVFASFVLNDQPAIKMLAIGMAFAVLIDASVVRMILVPAVMSLLGPHAWWMPKRLDPILPQLHLEGS